MTVNKKIICYTHRSQKKEAWHTTGSHPGEHQHQIGGTGRREKKRKRGRRKDKKEGKEGGRKEGRKEKERERCEDSFRDL